MNQLEGINGEYSCKIPIKELIQRAFIKIFLDISIIARYYDNIQKRRVIVMDAVKLNEAKIYTIDDIYALPDGQRAELIDGQIYYMAPPSWKHQEISGEIYYEIKSYIKKNNGKCRVLSAPFAVFLNANDDKNYLEPDISVICDQSKLDEKGCHGAPDWIIEIVSPSSKPRDYIKKMFLYNSAGVREYWIVDPEEKIITVYGFERESMKQYTFDSNVPVGIYKDFSIRIG